MVDLSMLWILNNKVKKIKQKINTTNKDLVRDREIKREWASYLDETKRKNEDRTRNELRSWNFHLHL